LILLVFLFILDRKIRTKKDLIVTGGSRSIGTSKSTKKIIFIASMIVICLGLLFFARHGSDRISVQENKEQSIIVDGNRWKVETAVTPAEREQGLSGRPSLCRGCGMLFIFENKGPYRFWMKDMNFDLDMLWIADGKIVQIDKDIPYIGGTSIIRSSTVPIDEVLEINAGESEQLGIKIGDELKYSD
jgi:uncharacterized membrane protein (UPF0127 family)